jgi:methionyl-tRNA formyltransferase
VTLRVGFLGNDPWSVPALEAIAAEPELAVELVVTNPRKAAGRGSTLTPTAVADAARALDVRLVEAEGVNDGAGATALTQARPDVLVVVAYGQLLARDALTIAPHGAINLHLSLLPRWRGAAPVQRAIAAGDAITGVTVMRMDEGLDTGPILNQLEDTIRPEDDAGSLGLRLAKNGALLLVGVLRMLPQGGVPARRQDPEAATYAPKITAVERAIDWTRSPEEIVRWVRALAPQPGATAQLRGERVKVLRAALDHQDASNGPPGSVAAADERGVLVRAGDGGVRLTEVAPAGRKRMDAACGSVRTNGSDDASDRAVDRPRGGRAGDR